VTLAVEAVVKLILPIFRESDRSADNINS